MEPPRANSTLYDRDRELANWKKKWGVCCAEDLSRRCQREGTGKFIIEGLIPERSLGLVVGDSGIGKSPLLYQAAICVAAGVPFLQRAVRQTSVLYIDFENGYGEVDDLITRLLKHLGLNERPANLLLWNMNDSPPAWGTPGCSVFDLLNDLKPGLAFIDPITAVKPEIEESNTEVGRLYHQFRRVISQCDSSIFGVHHRKKPSDKNGPLMVSLEDDNFRKWFIQARGASALVNGADIRLGVDVPGSSALVVGDKEEIALVLRGYGRMRGEIPTMHLARVIDDAGEPLGYRRLSGVRLLFNPEQESAFRRLPDRFSFKEAKQGYGKQDQATTDFLIKCIARGILRKVGRGVYEKLEQAE